MMHDDKDQRVIKGPEFLESVPTGSYGRTVFQCLKKHYDLPVALVDCITRKTVSFKELFEDSLRLACSLRSSGITEFDVIAISSENNVYFPVALIASLWIGATITLFNPLYTLREVVHVSNISKPSIIFCSKTSLQTILQAQKELGFIKKIITIDGDCNTPDVESMTNVASCNGNGTCSSFEPVDSDSQSVAFILYSSGTTGLPKGVMLTHYNVNACFMYFRDQRYFVQNAPGTSSTLFILPFFHSYGLNTLISGLLHGDTALVVPKFEPYSYLKAIQDFKLKQLFIVPPIAKFLVYSPLVNNYDLSHVESITSGAAPLSQSTQELLLKRFKKVTHIRQGYGLTEGTLMSALTPLTSSKTGAIGKLFPKTSVKVVDITGKSLGPGERGEICIKGPLIMKGYAGDITSTNNVIDEAGWLHTGDLGYYDTDEFLYIVDRLKELIKYKGFQVAPAELEAVLLGHPKVADAAVIGVPHDQGGEAPLAYVVKNPGKELTEDEVKNFVAEQVAPSKYLRGGVIFVQEIPKSSTGKILRNQLRQLVRNKSKL